MLITGPRHDKSVVVKSFKAQKVQKGEYNTTTGTRLSAELARVAIFCQQKGGTSNNKHWDTLVDLESGQTSVAWQQVVLLLITQHTHMLTTLSLHHFLNVLLTKIQHSLEEARAKPSPIKIA